MIRNPQSLIGLLMLAVAALAAQGCSTHASEDHDAIGPDRAIVQLLPVGDSKVDGTVTLTTTDGGVRIEGRVTGLSPGKHGFHVHEFGDVTQSSDGKSAGGHFAPRGHDHGKREDGHRHIGDLGNIEADDSGTATIDFTDKVIRLHGEHSVLGRSLVIHAGEDTYGQPTGDAGDRVAFGVIGVADSK